jgi:hypothetical protein
MSVPLALAALGILLIAGSATVPGPAATLPVRGVLVLTVAGAFCCLAALALAIIGALS